MGSWGPGNLENDGAQDELANICERLFNEIIELLQHPQAHEYDDEIIDQLFVKIEMVFALNDRGMLSIAPSIELLEPHLNPYIERWNSYHRDVGHGEWPERRKVIEATFDRLRVISSGTSVDGLSYRLDLISKKMSNPE